MTEIADVRRRLVHTIERARREAALERTEVAAANERYALFLKRVATPIFHQFATALKAEGYRFGVFTPAGGLRLASERNDDGIELALDTSRGHIGVVGRTRRGRGRRIVLTERPLKEDTPVEQLTEEDVLAFLLTEIVPFVEK